MKTYSLILCIVLLSTLQLAAQSIERQVFGTAGGSAQCNGISLDWTVGDNVVQTTTSTPDYTLTQGFQQAGRYTVTAIETPDAAGVSVFPNPVAHQLFVSNPDAQQLQYALFSGNGTLLGSGTTQSTQQAIDCSALSPGIYILKVVDTVEGTTQSFKILKQ